MKKIKECARVRYASELAPGIFELFVETAIAEAAQCGQFAALFTKDKARLLPRPISICSINKTQGVLRFVYRVAGEGTAEFSGLKAGDSIDILGTLGNGFPVEKAYGKRVLLLGGGIGVPPMLGCAEALKDKAEVVSVLGYRNADTFLSDEFEKNGELYIASEDGSVGTKGNVMDAINENKISADIIFACGPMPMLRAIKAYAEENNITAYISLEERMACGVGACLGCVAKTTHKDAHSHVNNARICTDGPVFDAREVDI